MKYSSLNAFVAIAFSTATTAQAGQPSSADAGVADDDAFERSESPLEEDDERVAFAVMLSPTDHLFTPILSRIAIFRPEVQIAVGDYVALDIMPAYAHYFGNVEVEGLELHAHAGGGFLGLRIAPMGTGLTELYFVPRFGAVHAVGSAGGTKLHSTIVNPTLEIGYAWAFGHFVVNAGGGAGYAWTVDGYDVYEASPIGGLTLVSNLSIGVGI
jgi:hypothetical protein